MLYSQGSCPRISRSHSVFGMGWWEMAWLTLLRCTFQPPTLCSRFLFELLRKKTKGSGCTYMQTHIQGESA